MAVIMLSEIVDLIRIGDEVEIVFLEEDKTLTARIVLVEGSVVLDALGNKTRHLWVILDEQKYVIQDEQGVVNQKLIRITFIQHSSVSQVKKLPVPTAPTKRPIPMAPVAPEAKPVFRPIPRDPRTIVKK